MAKEFPEILPDSEKGKIKAATTYVPTPSREELMRAELSDMNKNMDYKEFEATIKNAKRIAGNTDYQNFEKAVQTAGQALADFEKTYQNAPDAVGNEGKDGTIKVPKKDNPKEFRTVDLKTNDAKEHRDKTRAVDNAESSRTHYIDTHRDKGVDDYYLQILLRETIPPAQQQDTSKQPAKPKAGHSK